MSTYLLSYHKKRADFPELTERKSEVLKHEIFGMDKMLYVKIFELLKDAEGFVTFEDVKGKQKICASVERIKVYVATETLLEKLYQYESER